MKRALYLVVLALTVIVSSLPAAEPVSQAQDFRETPNPFQILGHQWSDYPVPQAAYNLEFLRTADRETARDGRLPSPDCSSSRRKPLP